MRKTKLSRLARIALSLVAVLVALVAVALVGHDFRTTERAVTIPTPAGDLAGVLVLPDGEPARGVVLMVHGDGPVDATRDGLYRPWFEAAADAGFATLSWSKPGIGGSAGDWLDQSMADRAAEVSAVIDWAREQDAVPTGRIALWGASQAGWVLPKVAAARADIDLVVAVSPAIDWLRQGRFNLLAQLEHDGASAAERAAAVARSDRTRELLERGASYEEYRAATDDPDPMSAGRWAFVARNLHADATDDLRAAAARGVPVDLVLAAHDRNVDVAETEATYREILGDQVRVTTFDAAHSMARTVVEDHQAVGVAVAVLWPRALLAPGVLAHYRDALAAVS